MTIKLSELKAVRVGMSDPDHYIHNDDHSYRSFEIRGCDTSAYMDNSCDARGIVATVKAAPALIAVVEAALRYESASHSGVDDGIVAYAELREALKAFTP